MQKFDQSQFDDLARVAADAFSDAAKALEESLLRYREMDTASDERDSIALLVAELRELAADSSGCLASTRCGQIADRLERLNKTSAGGPCEHWIVEGARDVLDRFFWRLNPDATGRHHVDDMSVKAVIRFCEKIIADPLVEASDSVQTAADEKNGR